MPKTPPPDSTAPPRVLTPIELRDDGTTILRWGEHEVTLRLPLIKQLGSYWDEIEQADKWRENDGTPRLRRDLLNLDDSPYAAVYAHIIRDLADQEIPPGEFPPFLADGTTFAQLWNHWWEHPLARSARLAAQADLASMTMSAPPSPPPPSEE